MEKIEFQLNGATFHINRRNMTVGVSGATAFTMVIAPG